MKLSFTTPCRLLPAHWTSWTAWTRNPQLNFWSGVSEGRAWSSADTQACSF